MTKPIKPSEVTKILPPEIIEIVNTMIQENWNGHSATIKQDALVIRISEALQTERQVIFDKGWLDFESLFRKEGWEVTYDKPSFDENFDAFFRFKA